MRQRLMNRPFAKQRAPAPLVALAVLAGACSHGPPSLPVPTATLLGGEWEVHFALDSSNPYLPPPTARHVTGTVVFTDTAATSDVIVEARRGWIARYHADFSPFFGTPIARDVSTSIIGPMDTDFMTRAHWWIDGRTLVVILTPQMSHGPVAFTGRLFGDSLHGDWYQRAYCCGAYGRIVMRRRL